MSATRTRRSTEDDTTPQQPQTTPYGGGSAGFGHDFTLQAVMDLKTSVGALSEATRQMSGSLRQSETRAEERATKLDEKLDKLEERLSGVTHKIYAASAVLVLVLGVAGWVFNEMWSIAKPIIVDKIASTSKEAEKPAQSKAASK